jgi:hypothetical protein
MSRTVGDQNRVNLVKRVSELRSVSYVTVCPTRSNLRLWIIAADPDNKVDEIPPAHSTTSGAGGSKSSDILMPSFLAVLRLMTNSNLVGCNIRGPDVVRRPGRLCQGSN